MKDPEYTIVFLRTSFWGFGGINQSAAEDPRSYFCIQPKNSGIQLWANNVDTDKTVIKISLIRNYTFFFIPS